MQTGPASEAARLLIFSTTAAMTAELVRVAEDLCTARPCAVHLVTAFHDVPADRYSTIPADHRLAFPLPTQQQTADLHDLASLAPGAAAKIAGLVAEAARQGQTDAETLRFLRDVVPAWHRLSGLNRAAEDLVDRLRPHVVLVGEDFHLGEELGLVAAAHRRGIPVICYAYGIPPLPLIAHFFHDWAKEPAAHRVTAGFTGFMAERFPLWRVRVDGRDVLPSPPAEIVASILTGVVPEIPWRMGGGPSDALLVQSEAAAAFLAREGAAGHKMQATGHLYMDDLCQQLAARPAARAALAGRLGLDPNNRLVVFSVPPEQSTAADDPTPYLGFARRHEALAAVIAGLTADGSTSVVCSLHPRCPPADCELLERHAAVRVPRTPVSELVALADLFVAMDMSTTISYALACGLPALGLRFYRTGTECYRDAAGCFTIHDSQSIAPTAQAIFRGLAGPLRDRLARARAESGAWGVLDGLAHRRVRAVMETALDRPSDILRPRRHGAAASVPSYRQARKAEQP